MNIRDRFLPFFARLFIVLFWLSVCLFFLVVPGFVYRTYIYSNQKSITVLTWPALVDTQYIQQFEKDTGIRVHMRYFETNEELLTKMQLTNGKGYDLIMPSEYMAEVMIKEGLLKKIDKTKLAFFNQLRPHLINNYYDAENNYVIPFFWSIYGIAIDKDYFAGKEFKSSWGLVFAPNDSGYYVSMVDDGRVLALLAAQYLYGSLSHIDSIQFEQIKQLLIRQKKWVELYTDDRANFLLASKACPVAVTSHAVVARIMPMFKNIEFIIPEEGSFLNIDVFAMPKTTNKDDLVYAFLSYMYSESSLKHHMEKFGYFSPLKDIAADQAAIPLPTDDQLAKAHLFKNILTKEQLSDLWIALKA
ncbi:MAG: extracellular solute-binding protein [Candidatus Dependentiae bacterium]|nr:extracellular solute-binding protein [Candidatus Dependentiae bacterium]